MELLHDLFANYTFWLKVNVLATVLLYVWRLVVIHVILDETDRFFILSDKEFLVSKGKQYASNSLGLWVVCLFVSWVVFLIMWMFF
ncbi:hypothetical protein VPH219E481_0079 [Vibrio phage 219E48-1]|nr:hypothetical protein PODOV021v1_p0066 [Vibrio phage 219E41.2]QZI91068.1 hypothetical protein PODOV032v1_p0063 [Vibrio phage 219E41.1]